MSIHSVGELSIDQRPAAGLSSLTIIIGYSIAIIGVEIIGTAWDVLTGAILHAALIPLLLTHFVRAKGAPYGRALAVLALVPLLRILSLTMPVSELPLVYWHVLIGAPLLLGAILTARLLGLSAADLGLRSQHLLAQGAIALVGVPLGFIATLIAPQLPTPVFFNWQNGAAVVLILGIFSAFAEEFVFRGLLQRVMSEALGWGGVIVSSVLFAAMYAGSLSVVYVLFIGAVGLLFGWCVQRTGSILGVTLAHLIMSVMVFASLAS